MHNAWNNYGNSNKHNITENTQRQKWKKKKVKLRLSQILWYLIIMFHPVFTYSLNAMYFSIIIILNLTSVYSYFVFFTLHSIL